MQNHHVHLILFRFDAGSLAKLKLQEACDHGEQLTLPADLSHHALLLQMSFGHHLGGCSSPSAARNRTLQAFAHTVQQLFHAILTSISNAQPTISSGNVSKRSRLEGIAPLAHHILHQAHFAVGAAAQHLNPEPMRATFRVLRAASPSSQGLRACSLASDFGQKPSDILVYALHAFSFAMFFASIVK